MDLNHVWTVNCMHHQFISYSLCAAPYQDKSSCCICSLSYHYACKFWCQNVYALQVLYTMSENYQTFEFHNTFNKNIYQTQNSTCQNNFLSYHSRSVFISQVSCTGTVREMWEASSMNASIIFQGVTAKLCAELFKFSPITPSDSYLCHVPFVQLQLRLGACHTLSLQEGERWGLSCLSQAQALSVIQVCLFHH